MKNEVAEQLNQSQIIRQVSKPSLVLDDMAVLDTEYGTNKEIGEDNSSDVKYTKAVAGDMPMVFLNKIIYRGEDIAHMTIDSKDFLPTISLRLLIRQKFVYSTSFPKDGDIVSIFIRSKDDVLKPIRNDYYITSVSIESSKNEMGYDFMNINGILYVPRLMSQVCSYQKGKSIDVLHRMAESLKIGFATNETDTSDTQTWLSAYEKQENFIKEITYASWKNQDSFFTSFIDVFYHLNFVNVDPMFSEQPGFESGIDMMSFSSDYDDYMDLIKSPSSIILTNSSHATYSKFRITNYEQVNLANAINFKSGYLKFMHYYDALLKEKIVFHSDPKTTPGSENTKYLMKGRNEQDNREDAVSHNWVGTIYGANGENCHSKFTYAKNWNYQNLLHMKKLYLEVSLEGVNMNLRRFQVVPVIIVAEQDMTRKEMNADDENSTKDTASSRDDVNNKLPDTQDTISVDKFYSGFYVIDEISYIYDAGQLKQKISLLRREWPVPPKGAVSSTKN